MDGYDFMYVLNVTDLYTLKQFILYDVSFTLLQNKD